MFKDTSAQTLGVDIALDDVTVTPVATVPVTPLGPFVNGSFELITNHAAIPSGGWSELTVGDTWLVGWTVGRPGNDLGVVNGTVNGISPYDGQQWISFNGGDTPTGGSLSQTFLTTPGSNYGVSFYVYKTGSGNVSITATALAIGGSLLASNYCAPAGGTWTQFQFSFTASTTNTTLEFLDSSTETVGADIELDDVTVVAGATAPVTPPPPVVSLVNGSFETPVTPTRGTGLNPGDTWLTGWTIGGPGGDMGLFHGTNGALIPFDGAQWVYFGGINTASGGSVSQSFGTVAGTSYVVTYHVGQVGPGNFSLTGTASSGGTLLASNRCVSVTNAWIQCQLSFTASGSYTTVTFTDTSVADTFGGALALDDVMVAVGTTPVAPAPPAVGPFVNGSFEFVTNHAAIPSGGWAELTAGDTWLVGWTVGGPGNDLGVVNGTVNGISPYDGQQWICFNGGNTPPGGSLSQTFLTAPGSNYGVSFYVYKTGSGNVSITATALAAGGSLLASNYCAPPGGAWTQYQFSFTATTTNATLVFLDSSTQTLAVDIELDDVTVISPPGNGPFTVVQQPTSAGTGGYPGLTIGPTASGLVLSWSASTTSLRVQQTTNLGTNWTYVAATPFTNGGTVLLSLPAPVKPTFFRLAP